ncbi:MAG: DNA polymerase I [Candidatus Roseilinea sp.]|uniref:DNA polymerase I n=1 Tax=Candidatus Roseilinea sp. TaxID=2838777 RepID=UPI00404985A0
MTRPKLMLIDGHSLAYRAYFAMQDAPLSITREDGQKELTNAVYAFTNMLLKVWNEEKPDYIAVAFDVGRTFRDDIYADYKGTRQKMPDELAGQMKRIAQVVNALGIATFTAEGFEADDVLGTLARRAAGEGMDVLIVTGDRDALQLVNPAVKVLTSGRSFDQTILYDEAKVKERFKLRPDQLIDFKALVGDASDNVPGVRGVGEKTAQALLEQHETLDGVYAHLDDAPKRARTALETGKDSAYLSRTLVTIRTDVPLAVDWEACRAQVDYPRALALFRELEFASLVKRIPAAQPAGSLTEKEAGAGTQGQLSMFGAGDLQPSAPSPAVSASALPFALRIVDNDEAYRALLGQLNAATRIAFDTETSALDTLQADLIGVSLAVNDTEGWYVPCRPPTGQNAGYYIDPASPKFEPIARAMGRSEAQLVAHNAKFDLGALRQAGVSFDKPVFDTMLAQFLCDPGGRGLGLKALAFAHFGWQMTDITELIGKGKSQLSMADVPLEQIAPYAAADAVATFKLAGVLEPQLRKLNLEKLFYEVEVPLIPVLLDMELTGVTVDINYLGHLSVEIGARLRELEKAIYNTAGVAFNINSTQQLADVLFGKLGLPTQGVPRTAGGSFSTAADVLDALRDKHEIIPLILEYRELSKLKGTYVDALPALINPRTGRIHTDYNQAGAVTGRLSSSNPNLQNIPIKTEMGRRVRKAFVARRGWQLISADYSQVELRILAHLADDPALKGAFERGEDIHATTAAAIYDVPLNAVNAMQRSYAKRINFGIAYGMGAFALAQNTGMSQADAQEFIRKYFERFPRVRAWLDATKRAAAEQGYVETVLGRRRYFPELAPQSAATDQARRRAEREAINHPVQGSAADIMKIAMINVHRALNQDHYQARLLLQVHDELVLECPPSELDAVKELVKREMESAFPLSVRLKADVATGPNWDEVQ